MSLYELGSSKIHGVGVLATKNIKRGTNIGTPLYLRYYIFPHITKDLGAKINHSYNANCYLSKDEKENKWYLIARKKIKKHEEITINYNETPWFIDKPMPWYV